jgi:hypothetical protein
LGGEGEDPSVISVNILFDEYGTPLTRRSVDAVLAMARATGKLVRGSAGALPFGDLSFNEVRSRNFPVMGEFTLDGYHMESVFAESFRVLRVGGRLTFGSSASGVEALRSYGRLMAAVGFVEIMQIDGQSIGTKL